MPLLTASVDGGEKSTGTRTFFISINQPPYSLFGLAQRIPQHPRSAFPSKRQTRQYFSAVLCRSNRPVRVLPIARLSLPYEGSVFEKQLCHRSAGLLTRLAGGRFQVGRLRIPTVRIPITQRVLSSQ